MTNWRIIDDGPCDAIFNMSIDEAISEAVRKNFSPPTLRLYQWERPSLSIGCFQNIHDINLTYCRTRRYPIVRRPTGGMAILHNSELTYSFSARTDMEIFKGGLLKNYLVISGALVSALRSLDIDARVTERKNRRHRSPLCFKTSSYGEITVKDEKIIGSAQKRYKNGFLQHGSIIMDSDIAEFRHILKNYDPARDMYPAGTIKKNAPWVSYSDLRRALKKAFERTFDVRMTISSPTEFELNRAGELADTRYSTKEWTFRR